MISGVGLALTYRVDCIKNMGQYQLNDLRAVLRVFTSSTSTSKIEMFGTLRYNDITKKHEHVELVSPSGIEARGYTAVACHPCRARKVNVVPPIYRSTLLHSAGQTGT